MLLLPEPGKDETLYSLVARIARMNGITNHVELMRTLLGEERPTSAIDARVNLDAFCDATHGAYGEPQEVLQRFSALPLRGHLAELDDSQFSGIARGDLRRTFSEVAFGGRCNWRVCRACIDQDLNVIGIAYWHRVHQLPTSQWCPEHGIPLQPYDLIRKHPANPS